MPIVKKILNGFGFYVLGFWVLVSLFMFMPKNPGLPKNLRQQADLAGKQIAETKNLLETSRKKYHSILESLPTDGPLPSIIREEHLEKPFDTAAQDIDKASQINRDLARLLKKDKEKTAATVRQHMQDMDVLLAKARRNIPYPVHRITRLQSLIGQVKESCNKATEKADAFSAMAADIKEHILARVKADFPKITQKIDQRFFPLAQMEEQNIKAKNHVAQIYSQYEDGLSVNYHSLADAIDTIDSLYSNMEKTKDQYTKMFLSLYTSYTKILDDMKEEARSGRQEPEYFHKYFIEKDGKTRKDTSWEPVSQTFYMANIDNLGMAILSKKVGQFDDEANEYATPPGIAYMGDPKYGEWKTDSRGNSFWSWYGKYAFFSSIFMFPPRGFGYNHWDGFRRNYRYDRPYYGRTASGQALYGSKGYFTKRSSRYQRSSFARTGGFFSQSPSARNGGSRVRGGGPGRRGK